MNQKVIKKEIVNRISQKLSEERIVIGGNKGVYKRRYHLKYTKAIILLVVNAFLEVMVDVIEEGDYVSLDGYFTLKPKYKKEIKRIANIAGKERDLTSPAGYTVKLKRGVYLKEACRKLTERESGKEVENIDSI